MSYATQSNPPPPAVGKAGQVTVVGPQFVSAYPMDLIFTKKLMAINEGSFAVTDVNGVMFKVKGSVLTPKDLPHLVDQNDLRIVSFRQKLK